MVKSTFEDLGIQKDFIKGLKELKIINPSDIQEAVIPLLLGPDTDLVGQAQTGTGKTAAFGLPLLHKVDPNFMEIQGLILTPTRELGQQVAKQLFKFTKYTDRYFVEAVYGGAPIDKQIANLKRPTHIVVATPGRLIDLVKRKALSLKSVKTIILDEADEMLSMGFKSELEEILGMVAQAKSKWLFSATMPHEIRQIVNEHLSEDAIRIQISSKEKVNKMIEHQYVLCQETEKLNMLLMFLKSQKNRQGVVFCKTKAATKELIELLKAKGISADGIHGDLLQKERDKVMRAFKKGTLSILVATDIAARGLDIEKLAFVAHYELPDKAEYYTHRSGRTARAGERGISICFVTSEDMKHIRFFENRLHIVFNQIK